MKKILSLFSLVLVLGVSVLGVKADTSQLVLENLYTYDKLEDGSFGYNQDKPIYFYKGSEEQVKVPKNFIQPKRQMKSGWVATIFNINIPTPKNEAEFQKLYMERLNDFVDWNMNAMIFQIRPLLDAYYPSEINPTSEYLSGKQGVDVDYDPLEWMIEKTHEAGLEYHAWLNPYRVTNSLPETLLPKGTLTTEQMNNMPIEDYINLLVEHEVLSKDNFAVKNPEYVIRFGGKLILNPGHPEVRKHIMDTVEELITNYDLDAIHFDDYFYPYSTHNKKVEDFDLQDREAFEKYGLIEEYEDNVKGLAAWRRSNVTRLIEDLNDLISKHNKDNKRAVQLGISPFGIWEHKANNEAGSNTPTSSSSTYEQAIYADTKGWVDAEIIDYIAPQIYWTFDTNAAPYGELARWWSNTVEGKNVKLYVGHPNYKYIEGWKSGFEFLNPEEINNQVKFNQLQKNISGSILFSYRNMRPDDLDAITDEKEKAEHGAMNKSIEVLKSDTFNILPLAPELPWLSTNDVKELEDIVLNEDTIEINDQVNDNARYYVIYRGKVEQSKEEIIENIANLEAKVFSKGKGLYKYEIEDLKEDDQIIVTVLDRAGVETSGTVVKEKEVDVPEIPEEPKPEKPKPEKPKPEEPKPEEPKPVEPKPETPGKETGDLPATGMGSFILTSGLTTAGLGSIALFLSKRKRK